MRLLARTDNLGRCSMAKYKTVKRQPKHTRKELAIMQAYPLNMKISIAQDRIRKWVQYWGVDNVAVSLSGGKDSTVLLRLVRSMYPTVKAFFVDTGLEYPENRKFAKGIPNVEPLYPKMSFVDVIREFGYPVISKEVSERVENARRCLSGGAYLRRTLLSTHRRATQ